MSNRVEMVNAGEWESWCREHPLPNGDTGVCFARWEDALHHALTHWADFHAIDMLSEAIRQTKCVCGHAREMHACTFASVQCICGCTEFRYTHALAEETAERDD